MADTLAAYRQKRDFRATPEPRGAAASPGKTRAFVIQKHAARSLHYDFRLELDGTLKSWAVPKGPSLDPAQKRMAVHVEDHPLDYGSFEGEIPPNQYGAGHVIVWDRGTWEPVGDAAEGYRAGKLKFRLDGEKLRGLWMLVKMHGRAAERQEPWLLIKERDDYARPADAYSVVDALPDSVLSGAPLPDIDTGKREPVAKSRAKASASTKTVAASKTGSGSKTDEASKTNKASKTGAASKTAATPKAAPPSKTAATSKTGRATKTGATSKRASKAGTSRNAVPMPAGAVEAPLPATLSPELATLVASVPAGDDWTYEIKFDGYRILARIDGRDVRLVTRNGNDWTGKLRGIASELEALGLASAWLDGEIVVLNEDGASDFGALQRAFDSGGAEIAYFVFDLPWFNGHDLRAVKLEDRRALLAMLLGDATGKVRFSQDFQSDAADVLHNACRLHLEGLIGKRLGSPYVSRRSPDWVKLKCTLRQEFVIGGYTEPQGSRTGLGALLLGIHDERGRLRYAGSVGTGFDTRTLGALRRRLSSIETAKTPFFEKPREAKGTWVEPTLVAEVSFAEWTRDGKVRQAVFHGLRVDKPAESIRRELPAPAPRTKAANVDATSKDIEKRKAPGNDIGEMKPSGHDLANTAPVRITNPDRVIDPSTHRTKHDLVDHYVRAARRMLPHLMQRPVALLRAPAGIDGQHFFQKHSGSLRIEELRQLPESMDPGHPPLIEIDTFTALISAAQMNVVEFHTWNASSKAIEKPDRMTFDLDPGAGVEWRTVVDAAKLTKAVLDELGLRSFLKTSGGKGLHVVVPLMPREGWDAVKEFSHEVVHRLASLAPDRLVAKSGPRNRVGRIFIDYLRNGRGATTAAAFSARARPGLGVSVPCSWDEIDELTGGDHWNIGTVHERLESAEDPWADYGAMRQTLTVPRKALQRLAAAA